MPVLRIGWRSAARAAWTPRLSPRPPHTPPPSYPSRPLPQPKTTNKLPRSCTRQPSNHFTLSQTVHGCRPRGLIHSTSGPHLTAACIGLQQRAVKDAPMPQRKNRGENFLYLLRRAGFIATDWGRGHGTSRGPLLQDGRGLTAVGVIHYGTECSGKPPRYGARRWFLAD